jgi:effector-binding domain-containing protein
MVVQDITLKKIPPRTIAYLSCRGSWRQLPDMLERLDRYMCQTSLRAVGPPSGIYYNTPSEVNIQELEWEIFYPVETEIPKSVNNKADYGIKRLPETQAASIIHRGSYRKAGSSYKHLDEWIRSEGSETCGPSEEVYISVFGVPSEEQMMEIRIPVSSA